MPTDLPNARLEAEKMLEAIREKCPIRVHYVRYLREIINAEILGIQVRTIRALRGEITEREVKARNLERNPSTLSHDSIQYRGAANAFHRAVELCDRLADSIEKGE